MHGKNHDRPQEDEQYIGACLRGLHLLPLPKNAAAAAGWRRGFKMHAKCPDAENARNINAMASDDQMASDGVRAK
ncbi:hypothetical protein [Magnetospirillum sp. XM-1]|uniref:hypothetical protein n=1 Tax=Magnetospirillum sp. XM-1 TaxID=1663591 RepID=UPI00155F86C4|nr:hypothetical protein [Magnetospirillum sp. XM-1]